MAELPGRSEVERGGLLHRRGELSEAIASYRRAIAVAPDFVEAHNNLGAALLEKGDLEEASLALERARELSPDFAPAGCNLGNVLLRQGKLDEASAVLQQAAELDPHDALTHFNLAHALHLQGRLDAAAASYRMAFAENPRSVEALSNLGTVLKELNRASEAEDCYRQALALRPGDETLTQNLRSALNRQLPAWHFPMLADEARNDAYRRAIENVVDSSSRVLDIGTGSGLLAMMAARAGAATVTACEMSPVVAEAARQVISDNGLSGTITVVDKKSTALRLGDDMAEQATVLVSEILDVGLLGEGVLPALRHAKAQLLERDAVVIPQSATVFAKLIELPRMRPVHPVREISGFDVSAFDRFRIPGDYLDIKLDHEPHRFLSGEFQVAAFDFRALPPSTSATTPNEYALDVKVTATGAVHAVAFWFELRLDETTKVSTRPGDGSTAWGQAVQFFEKDIAVSANERVSLAVEISDTRIAFRHRCP